MTHPCVGFGGLAVRLSGPRALLEFPPLLEPFSLDGTPDVHLSVSTAPLPREAGWFRFERADFGVTLDLERGVGVAWLSRAEALPALLGVTVQTVLLWRGEGLVLHASAGVHEGRAWVACGRSEAGKSTAARAAGFDEILSDEMVVVRRGSEGWTAWSTPFWSKGRTEPLVNRCVPLHRVVRLHQADAVYARPLAPDALVAHLLESVTLHQAEPWARQAAFDLACEVAEVVAGIDLWFTKEDLWIPVACLI